MPINGRLPEISTERNEPLDTLIPRVIEDKGSILRAAMELGVAPTTIRYWLARNGLEVKVRQVVVVVKKQPTTKKASNRKGT